MENREPARPIDYNGTQALLTKGREKNAEYREPRRMTETHEVFKEAQAVFSFKARRQEKAQPQL